MYKKWGVAIILLVSTILLHACNSYSFTYISNETKDHYLLYKSIYEFNCNKKLETNTDRFIVTIVPTLKPLINDNRHIVGLCFQNRLGHKYVLFERDYWDKASTLKRNILVFHELSHCLLDKKHVHDANSYMYPTLPDISMIQLYDQFTKDVKLYCN